MRIYQQVEVEIDVSDVVEDLDDKQLSKLGLLRASQNPLPTKWHELRQYMRQGDHQRLFDLLADMAWTEAGVILPRGMPLVH